MGVVWHTRTHTTTTILLLVLFFSFSPFSLVLLGKDIAAKAVPDGQHWSSWVLRVQSVDHTPQVLTEGVTVWRCVGV